MSNRYLDKVASFAEKRRMARAAVDIAANNPMTTAFGAGGALDGALSTTAEHGEGDVRVALRGWVAAFINKLQSLIRCGRRGYKNHINLILF